MLFANYCWIYYTANRIELLGYDVDYYKFRKAYYKGMNWDPETGEPSRQRLQELGL